MYLAILCPAAFEKNYIIPNIAHYKKIRIPHKNKNVIWKFIVFCISVNFKQKEIIKTKHHPLAGSNWKASVVFFFVVKSEGNHVSFI